MRKHRKRNRGTALVLAIVLSVVISGLVTALAFVAGQESQSTGNMSKMDQAFFAAEAGLQRLAYYGKYNQLASVTSPLTGTVNGYSYRTSWTSPTSQQVNVTSVGSLGSVSYTLT